MTAAAVWSDGFTSAAAELRLPIQCSMATPSNLLQSLHQPAVTNFRVSGDYADGGSWDIGWSSVLVWALGAARVISDCHFSVQLNHFILGFLSYSVPVFLK